VQQFAGITLALAFGLACAAPPSAAPQRATAWGYVKLVPKAGQPGPDEGGYSDRRLQNVQRFDYSRPAIAVVFAPAASPAPPTERELSIEAGVHGAHWSQLVLAIGVNDRLRISNRTGSVQVISAPELAWLRELAPREEAELAPEMPGELLLHLLGVSAEPALVWSSPGVFTLADAAGRYELRDLAPGPIELRAWHPRLPPTAGRVVRTEPGTSARLDLEIGVDQLTGRGR
jgi:hypothetical protein